MDQQQLPPTAPDGKPWLDSALHLLGASWVAHPDDHPGPMVHPPVDITKYADAVAEVAMTVLRTKRNAMLADCDWTQLPDAPLTKAQLTAWRTYRQALRDLRPNAEWPKAPEK